MSRGTIILIFLTTLFSLFCGAANAGEQYQQIRVYYGQQSELQRLMEGGYDIVWRGENYVDVVCFPQDHAKIIALGLKTEVIYDDLVSFYQSRLDPSKDMGGYSTLSEINARVDGIISDHPTIVSAKISIGQSYEGREIWAFKISDNPEIDEDEPEVLMTSAIHAREVITPLTVLNFVDYLTNNYAADPVAQDLVNNREIWIIPVVNPDGYYYNEVIAPGGGGMWRKTRCPNGDGSYGVDLNRNFSVAWAYNNQGSSPEPSSETYRGTAAFSEPESQHIRDFAAAHQFIIVVFFHSFGNILYNAWQYNNTTSEDDDIFYTIGDSICTLNGYNYMGFMGSYSVNGCTDDWFYGEQTLKPKSFAFTHEIGNQQDGFWPIPARIPELVAENLPPCIFYTQIADDIDSLYHLRPPNQPELTAPDTAETPDYIVTWILEDEHNPPVAFELQELTGLYHFRDSANSFDSYFNNGFELNPDEYHSAPTSFRPNSESGTDKFVFYELIHAVQPGDSVKVWMKYNLETGYDYAYVAGYDIIQDQVYFLPGNLTTTANPHGLNYGNGITGTSSGWVEGKFDLAPLVGRYVYIVLFFSVHGMSENPYVYFDDIYPLTSFTEIQTYPLSGSATSHSLTGRPEDDYYYRVRARDAEDQWGQFSYLKKTVVHYVPQYLCGDANFDDVADVSDAVYIINYVFVSGNPPDPYESGDANCDTVVDVSDAVFIVNYVFVGGNQPCDIDGDQIPDC